MQYIVTSSPNNTIFHETPARFTWFPHEREGGYSIVVYEKNGGTKPLYTFSDIDTNYFTPDIIMPPGSYRWNLYRSGVCMEEGLPFVIAENAVPTPLPSRKLRLRKYRFRIRESG